MPLMFNESGCESCRKAWSGSSGKDALEDLFKVNYVRQATLFRCKKCGGFWENRNGNYPTGLSHIEARELYGIS